jgi:hypothetical protein
VHHDHISQRIDRNSLRCINNIVKNACIVKRFAHTVVAKRRGPREPLALAALAALHDSLRECAVEEAKPRHHCNISGIEDDFFRSLNLRLQLISFLHPHAPVFGNKPSGCSRSVFGLTNFFSEPDGTRKKKKMKLWPPAQCC